MSLPHTFFVGRIGAGGVAAGPGEARFVTASPYSWTVPDGVTSVSVLVIGPGGGGGGQHDTSGGTGGALAYRNNMPVTPGGSVPLRVGTSGAGGYVGGNQDGCAAQPSYYNSVSPNDPTGVASQGGQGGRDNTQCPSNPIAGGVVISGTGFAGGQVLCVPTGMGGAGAAGYCGPGGIGGPKYNTHPTSCTLPPTGSGGGSGGRGQDNAYMGGGGGVGLFGHGPDGGPVTGTTTGPNALGKGGSGGQPAQLAPSAGPSANPTAKSPGGNFGGGGGAGFSTNGNCGGNGGAGAVRIIWPGDVRSFPSSSVAEVDSTDEIYIDGVLQ